jgi:phosphoadenosine phosphosulfate reductase
MSISETSSFSPLQAPPKASAIALYARPGADFAAKLDATIELLRAAAQDHRGTIVQATSLGAEDMVVTDLIARLHLGIAIGTLETGKLHPETSALIPRIEQRYELPVEVYRPREEQVIHFVRKNGEEAMYQSLELRKACCNVRKMEPLGRMLEGRTAWVTGLRREQSSNRGSVPFIESEASGRTKINPLADWTWNDVWHYIASHDVPYNPLHDEFMPSIGCAPCTRAIAVGEDFRAGRWWWEDEAAKECGLHATKAADAVAA